MNSSKLALEVRPDSGSGWIFKLARYEGAVPSVFRIVPGVVGIAGYNLNYISGRFENHDSFVSAVSKRLDAIPDAPSCTDGGVGATSCSISGNGGCSVTCDKDYWACCNVGSCTCKDKGLFQ